MDWLIGLSLGVLCVGIAGLLILWVCDRRDPFWGDEDLEQDQTNHL